MQMVDAVVRIDAPGNTRRLAGVDPALIARAARARAPVSEARLAAPLVRDAVADAGARPAGGDERARLRKRSCAGALFLDRRRPVARVARASARQAALVQRLERRARSGSRPTAPICVCASRANVDQLRRPAQHAERRGLHRPA